jgi:hypothetical protein
MTSSEVLMGPSWGLTDPITPMRPPEVAICPMTVATMFRHDR